MNEVAPKNRSSVALDEAGSRGVPGPPPRPRGRRAFFWARAVVIAGLVLALALWGGEWLHTTMTYVHETDARIKADLVQISTEVEGRVIERPVEEGERVEAGQMLARIDGRAAALRIAELEAERQTVAAELTSVDAEISMIDARSRSRILSQESRLEEARAAHELVQHEFSFAKADFDRAQALAKTGAISATRLDRARTDFLKARQELVRAGAEIAAAEAEVAEARADRAEIEVRRAEKLRLAARIAEIEARLGRERIDLEERTIRAPFSGVIGKTFVSVGEHVEPGQRLMVMHDPDAIWVETNVRETDIARVSLGQRVRVEVDAYPGEEFHGEVIRIGRAATNQFALLPRLNEAGTFTKVTQRIEVRIGLDRIDPRLVPGMMVEVFVEAGDAPYDLSGFPLIGRAVGGAPPAPTETD